MICISGAPHSRKRERRSRRLAAVLPLLPAVALAAAAIPAAALEIQALYDDEGRIHLGVEGRFYEFRVERAASAEGPYQFLGWRYIGCTEACEWIDGQVEDGATYWYRFELLDSEWRPVRVGPAAVDVPALTGRILGSRAFPSPFEEGAAISFRIPNRLAPAGETRLRLEIVDAAGRTIRLLHDGAIRRGESRVEWDGRDAGGRPVAAGSYWYRIQAGPIREAGRLVKLP